MNLNINVYKTHNNITQLAQELYDLFPKEIHEVVIVCIGTDRNIGDSVAPIVGSILQKECYSHVTVYGTVENPVHGVNVARMVDYIKESHPKAFIIAIDACLSAFQNKLDVIVREGEVSPGKGVGKNLPKIGDVSVLGVVGTPHISDPIQQLHQCRLYDIMVMSDTIVKVIKKALKERGLI